jgi:hypothetical protein
MTTASGSARACNRAARFGVSPTTDSSCAEPSPIRSPTTLSPVAMPTRACSFADLTFEVTDSVDDPQPGSYRPLGIVLMRSRVAQIDQDAVAHVFGDQPVEASDDIGNDAMISSDDFAIILGIETWESSVEPTRSQNITVSWRRSAPARTGAVTAAVGASAPGAAIASSRRRRCPTKVTPRSFRSSAVRLGNTLSSISFARNAGSYCSSLSFRSQSATSIADSRRDTDDRECPMLSPG